MKIDDDQRRALAVHFDAGFYLASNADVRESGVDPFSHFLNTGWREGRNPSRSFDVTYYLINNPDVAAAGINPWVHYQWAGRSEGRRPRRPQDAWRQQLDRARSPRVDAADWAGAVDTSTPVALSALAGALVSVAARTGLIITASHDDYTVHVGGVQNVIGDEQSAFLRAGWSHVHLFPAAPLPLLADLVEAEHFRVGVRHDGRLLGGARFADVVEAIATLRDAGVSITCVVHHLMGHAPELMLDLVEACGDSRPVFWIHDFFTICPSYTLMRNAAVYCGAPPSDSAACRICCYGDERASHQRRIHAFFDAARPVVLAPSAVALDLWRDRANLPHTRAEVVPHTRLVMSPSASANHVADPARRLRVAHLGARVFHKGWPVFEDLVLEFAGDDRYAFFQLGTENGPPSPGPVRHIPVRVSAERREAMVEAVAEARIDVVVCWSLWPETFCFTLYEALAGGAYVVAWARGGNLAPALAENAPDRGCVLDTKDALFALFSSDALRTRVAASPRHRGGMINGGGTADWLLRDRHRALQPPFAA
jgi:hypothetical protein